MENGSKVADGWRFLTRALSTDGHLKVSFPLRVDVDRDGNENYLGAKPAVLYPAPSQQQLDTNTAGSSITSRHQRKLST